MGYHHHVIDPHTHTNTTTGSYSYPYHETTDAGVVERGATSLIPYVHGGSSLLYVVLNDPHFSRVCPIPEHRQSF